jgi:Acetyltransferase (GNAT) domain
MDDELVVLPMTPTSRELELYADCFERNDSPKEFDLLKWRFIDNPVGKVFTTLAFALTNDRPAVAAIYATQPVVARLGGERVLALQSLDTLTDSGYRGRGLFSLMANQTFASEAVA